jgi:uncharacterized protein
MTWTEVAVFAIALLGGLVRGTTGFGGAMLMAPPLSFLIGPVPTVVIALTLEAAAALVMFPDAWPKINKRVLLYLIVPACFTVPIGGYLLITLDPFIARKCISAVVAVCSALLLTGLRYSGSPRPATSIVLGGIVGVMLGSTSVGAPPVIFYLLSGPDPHAVTRANLTVFVTSISVIGLVMLFSAGAATAQLSLAALLLCIPFLAGTWLGGALFARLTDVGGRRLALGFMLCVGIIGLVI